MLVLSRKINEQIVVGDNVVITVCAIEGGRVKLGFEAPPSVVIKRWELLAEFVRRQVARLSTPRLKVA